MVNSQYRKSCVEFIVLIQEYVLLLAFMQKQNGSSFQNGAVLQWSLSWEKQFIFSERHSFSNRAFLLRFLCFLFCRSSFNFLLVSLANSLSTGNRLLLQYKTKRISFCDEYKCDLYIWQGYWYESCLIHWVKWTYIMTGADPVGEVQWTWNDFENIKSICTFRQKIFESSPDVTPWPAKTDFFPVKPQLHMLGL